VYTLSEAVQLEEFAASTGGEFIWTRWSGLMWGT